MELDPEIPRDTIFEHHDFFIGHVKLRRFESDGKRYLILQVGARDLQFTEEDGTCVGAGTSLVGVYHDCAKCVEAPPHD